MFTICKTFTFEAAHRLPNHDGKCRNIHGHSYKVEVMMTSLLLNVSGPKEGMVIDFSDLKAIWTAHLEPLLDHQDLNVTLINAVPVTTAENLARWIYSQFSERVPISAVRVWETATAWAEYRT